MTTTKSINKGLAGLSAVPVLKYVQERGLAVASKPTATCGPGSPVSPPDRRYAACASWCAHWSTAWSASSRRPKPRGPAPRWRSEPPTGAPPRGQLVRPG